MNRIDGAMANPAGRIHSVETCGAVDGPGVRCVVFMQGCPLRCRYCQNPDTWRPGDGAATDARRLYGEIRRYRSYFRFSGGGVTLSGGEPLMQPEFAAALFRLCQKDGIHTALDTSGYADTGRCSEALALADLVILDLKCADAEAHKGITGVDLGTVLRFARRLSHLRKKTIVRHVLVPGLTDDDGLIEKLADLVASLDNVEAVEVLPFHNMGRFKWERLGYPYRLGDCPEPPAGRVREVEEMFARKGIAVPSTGGPARTIVA